PYRRRTGTAISSKTPSTSISTGLLPERIGAAAGMPGRPFLLTWLGNGRGARNLCRRIWRDLAQARHDPYRTRVAVGLRAARDAAADHQPAGLLSNAAGAERHARTAGEGGRDPAAAAVAGS